MLQSEMWIQKVVKDCASFGSTDDHLCFDNITEYDPDVVFDKNAIFSAFCSKCCGFFYFYKTTNIQVLIKKQWLKLQ